MKVLNKNELLFIENHFLEDVDKLFLKYHKEQVNEIDYLYCINQIKLRRKFADKFPSFSAAARIL